MIYAKIDDKNSKIVIEGIQNSAKNMSKPMRKIANMLENSVKENFDVGGRYSSPGSIMGGDKKWITPKYPVSKGKTLDRTGMLKNSIEGNGTNKDAIVSTGIVYAAIHNFGGKTKSHKIVGKHSPKKKLKFTTSTGSILFRSSVNHPGSKIDARPFMVIQQEDIDIAKEMISNHILKKD